MLWFSCGTAAELIKLYPILQRAERAKTPWAMAFTGQSPGACVAQWQEFGYGSERFRPLLHRDADLRRAREAASWFAQALLLSKKQLRERLATAALPAPQKGDHFIVHGDTLSTLLGATFGRRLGAEVAHVEAGLRTGSLRDPFPEEANRTLVGQLTRLHFAPTQKAVKDLERERVRGRIVFTHGNTQIDAVDEALALPGPAEVPEGAYGLVNVHRFETLISEERKRAVKRTMLRASELHPLVVVSHEQTQAWVETEPQFRADLEKNGARWLGRQPFIRFVHWLARARFIVADSAGNQNECEHLGIPCLLLRHRTEAPLLENGSVVLSRFENDVIEQFLTNPDSLRRERQKVADKPSDIIYRELTR